MPCRQTFWRRFSWCCTFRSTLRAEPRCDVIGNRVFVLDPLVYRSAGVTTGIDLMLQLIADTCGEPPVAKVAQTMVVALRRGPNDPELSPFLAYRNHLHAALHRVQDAVSEQPHDDWNVARMAEVAHTSARHLTRLLWRMPGSHRSLIWDACAWPMRS